MCTKSAEVCQMVGSVPTVRRRLVTETFPTSPKRKSSTDWSGDFDLEINLTDTSPSIDQSTESTDRLANLK